MKKTTFFCVAMLITSLLLILGNVANASATLSSKDEIHRFPLMNFTSVSVGPVENESSSVYYTSADYELPPNHDYLPVNVWIVADEEFRRKTYETT
jgi:hypothetical protein